MNDEPLPSVPPAAARRLPVRVLLLAILLAFAAGAAGATLAFRFWRAPVPPPPPVPAPVAASPPSVTALEVREEALAARIQALEGRAATIDTSSRTAASYAGRAEALMTILAVRQTLGRGQPLPAYLQGRLHDQFGDRRPEAVAKVIAAGTAAAGTGSVATPDDLLAALDGLAPKLMNNNAGEGWLQALRRQFDNLIVLRRGDSPAPRPADRFKRARHALEIGKVEAAVAEVERMPGVSSADGWLKAARRYVLGQQGLADLEESILSLPAPPPAADPAPAPAPAPPATSAPPTSTTILPTVSGLHSGPDRQEKIQHHV